MEKSEASVKVKSIFIYPIKSCRGISVTQAPIVSTGFGWDRQWMIVNSKGRMLTQRVVPKLALVEVELPSEAFLEGWEPSNNSYMVVRAPGMNVLKVHLVKTTCDLSDHVSLWEWTGSAFDEGAEAAEWFSNYIGKPSRLVRFDPVSQVRSADPEFADGYKNMFTDLFPFTLISQGSLDALNNIVKEPVSINRFRPNILVEGCGPFSEDLWKEIKINRFTFISVRLCSRCKIPSINQETGIPGSEPSKTLKTFRTDRILALNIKPLGQTYFGQNLVCKECYTMEKGKVIQVGDPVCVIKQVSSATEATA